MSLDPFHPLQEDVLYRRGKMTNRFVGTVHLFIHPYIYFFDKCTECSSHLIVLFSSSCFITSPLYSYFLNRSSPIRSCHLFFIPQILVILFHILTFRFYHSPPSFHLLSLLPLLQLTLSLSLLFSFSICLYLSLVLFLFLSPTHSLSLSLLLT